MAALQACSAESVASSWMVLASLRAIISSALAGRGGLTRSIRTLATPWPTIPSRWAAPKGEVKDAVIMEGAAIVDPNHQAAAIPLVGNTNVAGDRQMFVSGREVVLIVHFAIGCVLAMKTGAIPGGGSLFTVLLDIAPQRG